MIAELFIRWRGLLGTVLFHLTLALIFLIFGLVARETPLEEGLLINFGTGPEGSGFIEPASSPSEPEPAAVLPVTPPVSSESDQAEEQVLTQEFEESAVVESGKKEVKEEKTAAQIEAERKRQEELERQRQAEIERRRQEELERQRVAEEQRRIQEIYNRTSNAFAGGQNTQANTATGEGETGGTGNQGGTEGSVDSRLHADGRGLGNEGISYDLEGWTDVSLPRPDYKPQEQGIVVVKVTVDRDGNVIRADLGQGSTTLVKELTDAALKAARLAKFKPKEGTQPQLSQQGNIKYTFEFKVK